MRLRRKKNRDTRFERQSGLVYDKSFLTSAKKVELEIGAGKGGFITQLAALNPDTKYIAVERVKDCIIMAMEKAAGLGLENVRFILDDAQKLPELIDFGSVDCIYLNFSDPWPKSSHAKRRLTHRRMLRHFVPLLKEGGSIQFKTDNLGLFEFSLSEFKELGFELSQVTYDLHSEPGPNIMTEYEKRFSDMGVKINRLIATPTKKSLMLLGKLDK